ncbi:MAG: hypothetical protein EA399_05290 [Desulfovibrionales bacterium]|nr:MAG: hypothetical protein EA399_05290 [Desulfovibrionales bacterium]
MTEPFIAKAWKTLDTKWQEVGTYFTLSWVGPMHLVMQNYPEAAKGLEDVAEQVIPDGFALTYETRESEPVGFIMAVALHGDHQNGTCCRLLASSPLTETAEGLLTDFSLALWTLVEAGQLPKFEQAAELENILTKRTSPFLFTLRQEEITPPEELRKQQEKRNLAGSSEERV